MGVAGVPGLVSLSVRSGRNPLEIDPRPDAEPKLARRPRLELDREPHRFPARIAAQPVQVRGLGLLRSTQRLGLHLVNGDDPSSRVEEQEIHVDEAIPHPERARDDVREHEEHPAAVVDRIAKHQADRPLRRIRGQLEIEGDPPQHHALTRRGRARVGEREPREGQSQAEDPPTRSEKPERHTQTVAGGRIRGGD